MFEGFLIFILRGISHLVQRLVYKFGSIQTYILDALSLKNFLSDEEIFDT